MIVTEDIFDNFKDSEGQIIPIKRYTWRNCNGITVQVIAYGSTITSIQIPDKNGVFGDIVMGFDDMAGYRNSLNPYFGATVGRVANRVGYARFFIGDQQYQISANYNNTHQLHGGFKGFDKVVWESFKNGDEVVMSYDSKDLEEGYPGNVLVNVTYCLTDDNDFIIDFKATTTKPTFINLTNHSYFNLAGHDKGAVELYKHVININADKTTDVDQDSIPTGKLLNVAGTIFDLQIPKILGDVIHKIPGYSGYDHNFCINKGVKQEEGFIARVCHPPSGRTLEIYGKQPRVQFYTSNFLPGQSKPGDVITGKGSANYYKHGALCLETQNYPDAANHNNFPKSIYNPGETYHHRIVYKFYITT
nr:aldose 1-epimerase-like [Onthophagus taurus]